MNLYCQIVYIVTKIWTSVTQPLKWSNSINTRMSIGFVCLASLSRLKLFRTLSIFVAVTIVFILPSFTLLALNLVFFLPYYIFLSCSGSFLVHDVSFSMFFYLCLKFIRKNSFRKLTQLIVNYIPINHKDMTSLCSSSTSEISCSL